MDMQREVVVVSGVRTAIGDFGGGLKDVAPIELGAQVVREALARATRGSLSDFALRSRPLSCTLILNLMSDKHTLWHALCFIPAYACA